MLNINQKQNTTSNRKRQEYVANNAAWVVIGRKRGKYEAVTKAILSHQRLPHIRISNARIAMLAGCTIRTVIRITSWLHKMGYIYKHQPDIYDFNIYTISSQLKDASRFSGWLNRQPAPTQEQIMATIKVPLDNLIRIETVTQKSSLSKSYSISILNNPRVLTRSRARTRTGKEKKERGYMIPQEIREWILSQGDRDTLKKLIRDPRVGLISPVMQQVIDILKPKEVDYLKMISFEEPVLAAALAMTKKMNNLRDPMAYLLKACAYQSSSMGVTPEWEWYYKVCEILEIPTFQEVEPDERPSDMYRQPEPVHVKPKKLIPKTEPLTGQARRDMLNDQLNQALKDLQQLDASPVNPLFDVSAYTRKAIIKIIENLKREIEEMAHA